jgi:elongation factor G
MAQASTSREFPLERTRNIGIAAHIDAGKTTTTERILFYTGVTHKMGEVHDGNTNTDWMIQEQERGITITAAAINCAWKKHRINIIDTPGHVDFTIEVERSMRVLDGAVAVLDGGNGVEPQTETVWRQADKYRVPRICFVNKMDKVGADMQMNVDSLKEKLHVVPAVIQWPVGSESSFRGVVDLVRMVAFEYDDASKGMTFTEVAIPDDLKEICEQKRAELIDTVAEFDEAVMNKYLEGQTLSEEEIKRAIRAGTIAFKIIPVLCGSAFKNKGVQQLLDAVVDYLPSPLDLPAKVGVDPKDHDKAVTRKASDDEPLSALAFKIMNDPHSGQLTFVRVYSGVLEKGSSVLNAVKGKQERIGKLLRMHANKREEIERCEAGNICAVVGLNLTTTGDTLCDPKKPILLDKMEFPTPVISVAIEPKTKADQDKLGDSMAKLAVEDPSFRVHTDDDTGQTLISGMGELHLEIIVDRLLREFKVQANVGKPQVSYRETIGKAVEAEGKFNPLTGSKPMYGHVLLRISPLPRGKGFEFVDSTKFGMLPKEYVPSIKKGIEESLTSGIQLGFPIMDIKVELYGGSYQEADSNEMAFKIAASIGFKEGTRAADPMLLEPIMRVEVVTPEDFMGNLVGDLNSRRGKISGMAQRHGTQVIDAEVPLAEMFGYATALRSMSQGRASYSMQFQRYDDVPPNVARAIIQRITGF